MATYAIGDVQGCFDQLRALLNKIDFDPRRDRLWFCGDLVNRGPKSLQVLRFVRDLGHRAVTVMGNHDLHLVASAQKGRLATSLEDTLGPVLDAADGGELVDWLAQRPFFYYSERYQAALVHAGIPPGWSRGKTIKRSKRLKRKWRALLLNTLREPPPREWQRKLDPVAKLRYTCAALTRLRFVNQAGVPEYAAKGHPDDYAGALLPWYDFLDEDWRDVRIFFGHWSRLGESGHPNLIALDSGCVWGRRLTAVRVDGERQRNRKFTTSCAALRTPG